MSTRRKRSSKRKKPKSYLDHYETSVNSLLDDFDTHLDLSPILSNKTLSKIKYQAEEKESEIPPDCQLNASLETDDIPRIQSLPRDAFYDTVTESDCIQSTQCTLSNQEHHTQSSMHDVELAKQQEIIIESECKQQMEIHQHEHSSSLIHPESLPTPQLPQETVHNYHNNASQQLQHIQNISHNTQNIAHANMAPTPDTPQVSQSIQHMHTAQMIPPQFSQSHDAAAMQHQLHSYRNQNPLAWSQPQHQHQYNNNAMRTNHMQAPQWVNNSYFAPQQLRFSSHSASLRNPSQGNNASARSQSLDIAQNETITQQQNDVMRQSMKEINMKEMYTMNTEDDDIEENEDDENLFMPISPTLSGSALRALLSHLRRKCKTLQFQSKQQRKYIINTQHEISDYKTHLSQEKMKHYDQEQIILMLQNQNDIKSLEYLRGAELHQTRQELNFMMQKMNELEANNRHLQQQNKLKDLDHETYIKSMKEEYQRLLREINQHKVLFDQRDRELGQLKKSSDSEKVHLDETLKEREKKQEETHHKLSTITEQLASLRTKHEELKEIYDKTAAEKDEMHKLLNETQLKMDEKDQNLFSLQRVRDNLEQEIDALSRSNRAFREIRNKSTSQLLESQKHEIDSVKHQIAMKYDKYLDEEKMKNDKLQQLLKERDVQIEELHHQDYNYNEQNEYQAALRRLEIENHELRKQLENIQFGGELIINHNKENKSIQTENTEDDKTEMDSYHNISAVTASAPMDDFGVLMLNAAKEEIEQLRQTNETLMKLHAKNHFKKPRVEEKCTQTYDDNMNQTVNSSFMTVDTVASTQTVNFHPTPILTNDHNPFAMSPGTEMEETVLVHDTSGTTTINTSLNLFSIKELNHTNKC